MRQPNFFLVGAPKCGTTALYAMLGSHPDVFVSPVKEPDFLASDLRAAIPVRPTSGINDQAQYVQLFAGAGEASAVGEGSVSYLSSVVAPAAIHGSYPDARVIMVLRDPADRLFGHYKAARVAGAARGSFDAWFDAQVRKESAGAPFGPVRAGRYASHLRRYLAHFSRSRIHVMWHEDFVRDPATSARGVFAFLGVNPAHTVDVHLRRNETRVPRFHAIRAWLHLPVDVRSISRPRRMTRADRARAIRAYEDEIVALAALTGRNLDRWLSVELRSED